MTKKAVTLAAKRLDSYMKRRAEVEGVSYGLYPEFYTGALLAGVRVFFGVDVSEAGVLESDAQNPEAFRQFAAN